MKDNRTPLLIFLVALGGALYPQFGAYHPVSGAAIASGTSIRANSEVGVGVPTEERDRDALSVLDDFIGQHPTTKEKELDGIAAPYGYCMADGLCLDLTFAGLATVADPEGVEAAAARHRSQTATRACEASGYRTEYIVATVPDPIDSRTGWVFDRYVDAIQRAAEQAGYVPDRFFLPWQLAREAAKRCEKWEDDKGADCERRLKSRYTEEPGAILFRQTGVASESATGLRLVGSDESRCSRSRAQEQVGNLLIVLLVGETPTAGVHKKAFMRALDYAASSASQSVGSQHIRIMGPSFSGSVPSMKIAISNWRTSAQAFNRPVSLRIISGSATDASNKTSLESIGDVSFHATVVPDDSMLVALRAYFDELKVRPDEIAVLTEANTGYGSDVLGPRGRGWMRLRFPMHISQVRSEFQRENLRRGVGQAQDLPPAPRTSLELSLDDSGEPSDTVPALYPQLTSASDQLVLSSILSTIARGKFRYVGGATIGVTSGQRI